MTAVDELAAVARIRELATTGQARKLREDARIGLREMASTLGVEPSRLSRWETGKNLPRPAVALQWVELLDRLGERHEGHLKPTAEDSAVSLAARRVAANIRTFRVARSMSQAELGARLNPPASKASVSEFERTVETGRRAFPADLVAQLCAALNVTPNDLFGDPSSPQSYAAGWRDGRSAAVAAMQRHLADALTSAESS